MWNRKEVKMYFSNCTESMLFEEYNCFDCLNYRGTEQKKALIDCDKEDNEGGFGCPIMDLHIMYQGENNAKSKEILDYLLPNFKCQMRLTYEDIKNRENEYINHLIFVIGQLKNGVVQKDLFE